MQDQNKAVNVTLSQTVTVAPSKNFTFTGHSYYQIAASNNIRYVVYGFAVGRGAIADVTAFTVDFLDAGGNVIAGSSQTVNLPKNRPTDVNPDDWVTTTIQAQLAGKRRERAGNGCGNKHGGELHDRMPRRPRRVFR